MEDYTEVDPPTQKVSEELYGI